MAFKFNPITGQLDTVLDQASEIKYTPTGDLVATNVQAAVDELEQQILSLPEPIVYRGTWDASTNTPTLSNADVDVTGDLYQVNVAGTVDFGAGPISFEIGDKVVNNGTEYQKWDMTDAVTSVNGQVGVVSLSTTNVPEGTNLYYTDGRFDTRLATKSTTDLAEGTNLYYTTERAQDAVGAILTNSTTVNLVYDDGADTITASVNDASITDAKIATGIDAAKLADGSVSNAEFQYLDGVTSSIQTQINALQPATGTIPETSYAALTSPTPVSITGASFSNATIRAFELIMTVEDGTDYAQYIVNGVQKGADWVIAQQTLGDDVGLALSITSAGQLEYISSADYNLKFKTISVVGI